MSLVTEDVDLEKWFELAAAIIRRAQLDAAGIDLPRYWTDERRQLEQREAQTFLEQDCGGLLSYALPDIPKTRKHGGSMIA